jgi:hypothetical protein
MVEAVHASETSVRFNVTTSEKSLNSLVAAVRTLNLTVLHAI